MGEIQVLVDEGTCVTTDADISLGAYEPHDGGEEGGADLEIEDRFPVAAGVPELHVDADLGIGALRIGDGQTLFAGRDRGWWRDDVSTPLGSPMRALCGGTA